MDGYGSDVPPGAGSGGPWNELASGNPVGATQRIVLERQRRRRWIASLWALGLVVVVLAVVTVAVSLPKTSPGHSGSPAGGVPGTSTTSSSTSTPPPGAPVITALSPAQGSVGQVVVITGANLVSSDGQVLAHFGDVGAPTSCQSATSCSATVPSPSTPTPKVQVTVTTADGTSNPLPFTYQ